MLRYIMPILILVLATSSNADIINGGFESGDFSGWVLTQPSSECNVTAAVRETDAIFPLSAYEGEYFAQLRSQTAASYDLSPSILSQTVELGRYDRISGRSLFLSDEPYYDYASLSSPSAYSALVSINGVEVWRMDERQFSEYYYTHGNTNPTWQYWEWLAPSDGLFSVELVFNPSEQCFYTGAFDDIEVQVPEPSLVILLIAGLFPIVTKRFKNLRGS